MGAWIETHYLIDMARVKNVAPRMGAWIETKISFCFFVIVFCRAPHGRVD